MNRIGYAVTNETLKPEGYKTCRIKSPYDKGIDYVIGRAKHNVAHLLKVLKWNVDHGILLYRVSNDLIPLASHSDFLRDFTWRWDKDVEILESLEAIKAFVLENNVRLTMHPDPYVVLNSQKKDVFERSVRSLNHMATLLDYIGGTDLVIYIGGQYGNAKEAIRVFEERFNDLNDFAKEKIRIKNDESLYTLSQCIEVGKDLNIPVVFDYHHYKCNHTKWEDLNELTREVVMTWDESDRLPLVHIASGKSGPFDVDHGDYVDEMDLIFMTSVMTGRKYDLLIEGKKRELAAMKAREIV